MIWIKVIHPIWSFIINLLYWMVHIKNLKLVKKKKKELAAKCKNITALRKQMKSFSWVEDNWKDWRPWIITIIDNDYEDDCDGAAELARFLFKQIGIQGNIISLRGNEPGHAIYVSNDKVYMTSNQYVRKGNWTDKNILNYFKGDYDRIIN